MELPPADDAAQQPGRWMRLVRQDEFKRLIGEAIETSLVQRGGLASERARVLRVDALLRIGAAFGRRARRVRALTKAEALVELERTHGALLQKREQWNGELAGVEQELAIARAGTAESGLTVEEEATLARALQVDLETLLRNPDPAKVAGVLERERERRALALTGALTRERERIDLLERRITKLRAEIKQMEGQLVELARQAQLDPGLSSIYRTVQGLQNGEAEREAKARMLTVLFEQNLKLQRPGAAAS